MAIAVGTELALTELSTCCPAGLAEPLDRESAESAAKILKAVADPARLQLIALLQSAPNGSSCVCDLTAPLGLSQPTISHHLKVLADVGIVSRERRGTWAWYSIVPERMAAIAGLFG